MPDQVPVHVARERNRVLRELAAEKNLEFRRTFIGQTLDVITLQTGNEGSTEALSSNFLKISLAGRHAPNTWMKAEIEGVGDENLLAVAEKETTFVV
jgi:threonylcarbamoyladenosine tRNA methylthiotransferase MtaB